MPWKVTIRIGPQVRRSAHDTLDAALDAVRAQAAAAPRRDAVELRVRKFEPLQQVAARADLRGPGGRRGGIDVRGDGSAEAYTGRLRRRLVEAEPGEDAYAALRRALSSVSVDP